LQLTLKSINPEFAKAAAETKDYQLQLLLLRGALIGATIPQGLLISATKGWGKEANDAKNSILEIVTATDKFQKMLTGTISGTDALGDSTEKTINPLKAKIKAIKEQTASYKILRGANVDNALATELSNDGEIASLIIANGKGKKLKDLIKLVNQYKTAIKEQTQAAKENMSEEEGMTRMLALADLREKLIDLQFEGKIKAENDALRSQENALQSINDEIDAINKKEIDPLKAQIDANNFALQGISLKEDEINKKYETQITALDKIASINQEINNIQKQRMSIADALTRGDISAAAVAAQEARAQQAESAISGQRNALTAGRDAAITALGRNALEQKNKELQYQISVIENGRLLTLKQQKIEIEGQIQGTQRNIAALELEVQKLKEGQLYAGQTRKQIEDQKGLIDAADAAGLIYNATLAKQLVNAQGVQAAIEALDREVTTIHTIVTRNVSGDNADSASQTPQQRAEELQRLTDKIKKKISGRMYGGAITKYMAFGGRAVGSDTVPAMLTPGEFIVNKTASKAYGPMLKSLNESKYPSMLGRNSTPNMPVINNSTSLSDNSTAVYNYSLGFNINGSNSDPRDVARAVIKEIKNIDNQRIRTQRA
jgi:hypothetical protein